MKIIKDYLRTHKIKKLSKEECYSLIKEAQEGSIESRNKIMIHNIPMVIYLVDHTSTYYVIKLGFEDLFQEGMIGMIRAIEKFDCSQDFEFSTYAFSWVKQRIDRYITNNKDTVRMPIYADAICRKYDSLKKQDHYKTDDFYIRLVAKQMKKSIGTVRAAIKYRPSVMSSDITHADGSPFQIENFLDDDTLNISEINMDKLFEYLGENEAFVLRKRCENYTNKEIGLELNLTRERIRQIHHTALRKLRALLKKEINY